MAFSSCNIVILGLTITSSWGNGHATTYRGLMRELIKNGHNVLFLEHDKPWYSKNRDIKQLANGRIELYLSVEDLKLRFSKVISDADIVIVGSYIPDGAQIGEWIVKRSKGITAFYDIDTPVTLSRLAKNKCEYLVSDLIPKYDLYLSFAGGPILKLLKDYYGAKLVRPLYCSVDPDNYYPEHCACQYDLGYMGTYSIDRQRILDQLMFAPARTMNSSKFIVAGPLYPDRDDWPSNVIHREHIAPSDHRQFYCSQRFTLNLTRADMVQAGYAPSVRLFEASACGIPIISDYWDGLEEFFKADEEILISKSTEDTIHYLNTISDSQRIAIGERARKRVLVSHTAAQRAKELESYIQEAFRMKGKSNIMTSQIVNK